MELPNYFIADLPPGAVLTPTMITEACQTLKRNRERYLLERSTESLIRVLGVIGKEWLNSGYVFRQRVLEYGPAETGFSEPTLRAGLDSFFGQLTDENLENLITQELGDLRRLDKFSSDKIERHSDRASFARGPELLVHITGGVLPNPTLMSMILGLLTRSAQFLKCATGTSFIPRMFAHSLYEIEPKLGACLELAEWKGGSADLENALFAEAELVAATGSDETLEKVKEQLPDGVRFVGYGHRVSFGYVTHEPLSGAQARKTVALAAKDVAAWNQLGCLSPHVLYVETGGNIGPEKFAELLAEELKALDQQQPRGKLNPEEAANISYRRSFYEVRAAGSVDTILWQSENSTNWTVVFENDPRFQISCLNRFIYVKAVAGVEDVFAGADTVRGKVSTVGLAADGGRAEELAKKFARWGVTRICPLGQMQNPPLTWRHDGRPPLGDLVTWSEWEF